MSRPDYTAFDTELISLIKAGCNTVTQLQFRKPLIEMAKPFCVPSRSPFPPEPLRIIARRLQALRGAGWIKYSGGKWHIVE